MGHIVEANDTCLGYISSKISILWQKLHDTLGVSAMILSIFLTIQS